MAELREAGDRVVGERLYVVARKINNPRKSKVHSSTHYRMETKAITSAWCEVEKAVKWIRDQDQ